MFDASTFVPVVTNTSTEGDLLQQEEIWLLRVSGDRLLQLTGDGATTLHPIDGDYLIRIEKISPLAIRFSDATDPSSETPSGYMQNPVVGFTDHGVCLIGKGPKGAPPILFDLNGKEIQDDLRCSAYNWCGFVTLTSGREVQII